MNDSATDLNLAICEALGIDPDGVTSVHLHLRAEKWPEVRVRILVREAEGFSSAVKRYRLEPQ